MSARRERFRVVVTATLFVVYFLAALVRAFDLSVIDRDVLQAVAEKQYLRTRSMAAERGPIVDRNGDVLAINLESDSVYVDPGVADLGPEAIAVLAQILDLPVKEVAEKVQGSGRFAWLRRLVTPEQAAEVSALRLRGVVVESSRRRYYPYGSLAGQVLGFPGVDTQGLGGIEFKYNDVLQGASDSQAVIRDGWGREIPVDSTVPLMARPGARVELTIDADLQRIAEEELGAAVHERRAESGVAIVMDPVTGEILAMANAPTFDPNIGRHADPPLRRNRAVTDRYEPGSTFKTILAAAAIEADVVLPGDRVFCENGRYAIGRRSISDHDPYGWLTFSDVIRLSSNIGVAKIADRLGNERFARTIHEFGFGRRSGIDLPGEAEGIVHPAAKWKRITLATVAFGHGLDVTPLQVLRAYSAIANGGQLMRPFVVRRLVAADGTVIQETEPRVVARPVSADTAKIVSDMLEGVVESGTATTARVDGLSVAGKTGTARRIDKKTGRYSHREHVASFVGYFPADEPRFAILVVIDRPKTGMYGGVVAAPVFRRIGEYLADKHGLRVAPQLPEPPVARPDPVQLITWSSEVEQGMPSYLGLGMRAAIARAEKAGWDVETVGSGFVIAQDPPPGETSISGRKLVLRFGADIG